MLEILLLISLTAGVDYRELEYGAQYPNDAMERAQRTIVLRQAEQMPVLEVTRGTARSFGLLATIMRQAWRNPRPRYNDLWIAAQAHEHGYAILTSNPEDFRWLNVVQIIVAPKSSH